MLQLEKELRDRSTTAAIRGAQDQAAQAFDAWSAATAAGNNSAIEIFFAWQSDYKTSRNQIDDALKRMVKECNGGWHPMRPMVVTSATEVGDGAVRIDSALMEKIQRARLFVGDVTPILGSDLDLYPNPNVLIEVGYALASKAPGEVILVEHARSEAAIPGDPKDGARMPFDIDHVQRIRYAKPADLRRRLLAEAQAALKRLGLLQPDGET